MKNVARHYGIAIGLAILLALFIRAFIIEAYRIPVSAMRPTLESGDTVFATKWDYGIRLPLSGKKIFTGKLPHHGELVLFAHPDEPEIDYIKRVVGLPGDLIEVRSGHVIMNGTTLDLPESKIPESKVNNLCSSEKILDTVYSVCIEQPIMDDMPSVKVPEYTVFVLGDFRSQITTKIKKSWGLVPAASLKGKPRLIWLSITPKQESQETGWFYRVRFDRMLRRIN